MHYMRNGPKSQLWLFQFHECCFFIKAHGGGEGGQNIAFGQKRNNKGGGAALICKPYY